MKKIFLKFGTNAQVKHGIGGSGKHTSGDGEFNLPPMGAKPPTENK